MITIAIPPPETVEGGGSLVPFHVEPIPPQHRLAGFIRSSSSSLPSENSPVEVVPAIPTADYLPLPPPEVPSVPLPVAVLPLVDDSAVAGPSRAEEATAQVGEVALPVASGREISTALDSEGDSPSTKRRKFKGKAALVGSHSSWEEASSPHDFDGQKVLLTRRGEVALVRLSQEWYPPGEMNRGSAASLGVVLRSAELDRHIAASSSDSLMDELAGHQASSWRIAGHFANANAGLEARVADFGLRNAELGKENRSLQQEVLARQQEVVILQQEVSVLRREKAEAQEVERLLVEEARARRQDTLAALQEKKAASSAAHEASIQLVALTLASNDKDRVYRMSQELLEETCARQKKELEERGDDMAVSRRAIAFCLNALIDKGVISSEWSDPEKIIALATAPADLGDADVDEEDSQSEASGSSGSSSHV